VLSLSPHRARASLAPAGGLQAEAPARSLPYNPALDGLRGLAIVAVVLFHSGFAWARGGYLGVSTFFTLSGFLITSLLVTERRRTGRVDLGAFWARRVRRLLPAATVTLGVLVLTMLVTDEGWERSLPADAAAAALQVANWRFLFSHRDYGQLFAAPSPALHFWSLSIEEQFYWVFPLVAAGVLAVARGSARVLGAVLLGLVGVAAALTWLYRAAPITVYYATPIRMGEILVGALLAVALGGRSTLAVERRPVQLGAAALGLAALAGTAWAWWNVEQGSLGLVHGGLLGYALLSGSLVLAAAVPGPFARLLGLPPLRLLGVVSYGVYLIHWPLFLLMSPQRVDRVAARLPGDVHPRDWSLLAVRMVVVLAIAAASYRWFESPIRRGWRLRVPAPQVVAVSGVAAVLLTAFAVPKVSPPPPDPWAQYVDALVGPDPALVPPTAKVGVAIGDSTVMRTAWGLTDWGQDQGNAMVLVGGSAEAGCSIGDEGDVEYRGVQAPLRGDPCASWQKRLRTSISGDQGRYGHVDFAIVQTGLWDVANRRIPGHDGWTHIGERDYDAYLYGEMSEVADVVAAHGMTAVWLTSPASDWREVQPPLSERPPEFEPERMVRYNAMIRRLAARRDDVVVVDLAAYAEGLPPSSLAGLREDGIHWTLDGSRTIADWLGPQILAALQDAGRDGRAPAR
jgi:peptidoglycan/LPS O-acetylase OafA/YrhL